MVEIDLSAAKQLKIDRPLVFVDLETTGVNPAIDRIIDVTVLRIYPRPRACWATAMAPAAKPRTPKISGETNTARTAQIRPAKTAFLPGSTEARVVSRDSRSLSPGRRFICAEITTSPLTAPASAAASGAPSPRAIDCRPATSLGGSGPYPGGLRF